MPLTKNDLNNIKSLVEVTIDENNKLVSKEDIKFLPTKDEFYEKMDEVVGELKAIREEQTILSGVNIKVNQLEERTDVIEGHLHIQPAV